MNNLEVRDVIYIYGDVNMLLVFQLLAKPYHGNFKKN